MINLHRAQQRYQDSRATQAIGRTFPMQRRHPPESSDGFGALEVLDEIELSPNSSIEAELPPVSQMITYVLRGALAHRDALGRSGVIQAGEFRCVTVQRGVHLMETNASASSWTHLFHIGLRSGQCYPPAEEQQRFTIADRRDELCLVAAAEAHQGVLRIREDASIYSAMLQRGHHLVHDLRAERRAWLHVVSGEVALADLILTQGDGAGIAEERCVSFTARTPAEVLLLDVV